VGAEHPPHGTLAGMAVLVVDRHPTSRAALQQQLATWDVTAEVAESAEGVIPTMRRSARAGRAFAAAIVDSLQGEIDVLTLARSIKADPLCAGTRLILLSSHAMRGQAGEARAAGFDAFLSKPVRQSPLYDCLVTLLGPTPAARPRSLITRHSLAEARGAARQRILLAEDNEVNQKLAVALLERFGYRVEVVGTGAEAVRAVRESLRPGADGARCRLDGYEATEAIRREGEMAGGYRSSP
jgi:CheY-like chemotaxis protein